MAGLRPAIKSVTNAAVAACTHAQPDDSHLVAFSTQLRGDQEVPPATSMGRGQFDAVLDKNSRLLRWKLSHSGLTGPVTGAHFHGPAQPGANAPVGGRCPSSKAKPRQSPDARPTMSASTRGPSSPRPRTI